jgi:acetyltransferase-like isoleucine patch superfamily enzyme
MFGLSKGWPVTAARAAASQLFVRARVTSVGKDLQVHGRIWIHGRGRIVIGDRVRLDAWQVPIELHAIEEDAEIVIGDDVVLEGGVSIEAQRRVHIGARTRIGSYAKLMDNHFHEVVGDRTRRPESSPLVIGADVAIGARAILLPGAHVEERVVLEPGAVLTKRVRRGSIVSGVPARVIGMRDGL